MQDQGDHIGNDSAIEVDQGHVAEDLLGDARLGIGRKLQDEKARFPLSLEESLDQAVRELPWLDHFGLERPPGFDAVNAGDPEDRVA